MKTKLLRFSLYAGIVLSFGSLLGSCTEPVPTPDNDTDESGNVFTTTPTVTPLRYTETEYKGGDNGVSINVTSATAEDLVFTCKPGRDIQSYFVAAYPVAFIYDVLFDNMALEGKDKYTVTEVNDFLRTLISNVSEANLTGQGRFVNERADGEEFYELTVDYMEIAEDERPFTIQPDMDYIIVAFASFNDNENWKEEGFQDFADLCICHVRSEYKDLVGEPKVLFNVTTGFTSYKVEFLPNEDCKYFYDLTAPKASIENYINAYGDDMYSQLVCNYGGRVEAGAENKTIERSDVQNIEYMTTSVALDANGTANKDYNSYSFKLKDIPEGSDKAECEISMPHRVGGSIVEFKAYLAKNCKDVRYGIYPASTVTAIMAGTDEEKEAYAVAMCSPTEANPVWGISNFNFSYDMNNAEDPLHGSLPMDVEDYQWELAGDTEYRIIYAGYDRFNRPGELKATDVFKTKTQNRYNPDASKEDIVMDIPETSRTSVTLHFEYTKDNTALYLFQYYDPMPENPQADHWFPVPAENYTEDEARQQWMHMFYDFKNPDPFQTPWPNMWRDEGDGEIKLDYLWSGFSPATTFKFAYIGEDWDGNIGEVKFCECKTLDIEAGDNPTVTTTAVLAENGSAEITYQANEQTSEIRYMFIDKTSAHYNNSAIDRLIGKKATYEEFLAAWEEIIMASDGGLKTSELKAYQTVEIEGSVAVAMAVAVGGVSDPVWSAVSAVVFIDLDEDGKIESDEVMSLEEYYGIETAKSNRVSATVTLDRTPGTVTRFAVRPRGNSVMVKAL